MTYNITTVATITGDGWTCSLLDITIINPTKEHTMTTTTFTPGVTEYREGRIASAQGYGFYSLIEAAMRTADSEQIEVLRNAYPNVYADLMARYDSQNTRIVNDMC